MDLHNSGSYLGAISKYLKVPHSSSGRRHILSPRDEHMVVQKVQINPGTTAQNLVKMLEEMSTVKQVLYRHNLKGCLTGKKSLLKNHHKPDYNLQVHVGDCHLV